MLKQSSLAGSAEYRTQSPLLRAQPHAVDILIDVLSDRGFRWAHWLVRGNAWPFRPAYLLMQNATFAHSVSRV